MHFTYNWFMETGNNNGWGNNELEYYCPYGNNTYPGSSSDPNVYQDGNGSLVIKAFPVASTYTSARLRSYPNVSTQYGPIEARMQVPYGDGLWPAFWMLSNSIMMDLDSTEAIKSTVGAGLGIGFVSRWAITKELELRALRVVQIGGVKVACDFSLALPAGPEPQGAVRIFRAFALERARFLSSPSSKPLAVGSDK